MSDNRETPRPEPLFDFSAYPPDSVFHDRRSGLDRRDQAETMPDPTPVERRARPDRRRRIDPTTFEKQYTPEELEFMNAMQYFKVQSGKAFPSYGDVLRVAERLGYHRSAPTIEVSGEPE